MTKEDVAQVIQGHVMSFGVEQALEAVAAGLRRAILADADGVTMVRKDDGRERHRRPEVARRLCGVLVDLDVAPGGAAAPA